MYKVAIKQSGKPCQNDHNYRMEIVESQRRLLNAVTKTALQQAKNKANDSRYGKLRILNCTTTQQQPRLSMSRVLGG